jgi:hypothetical protein
VTGVSDLLATIRLHRKLLTAAALLVAAAAMWAAWRDAERNRQSLILAADGMCAAAGSEFRPAGAARRDWGVACLDDVRALAAFKADTVAGSLQVALDAMERRQGKEAADAALAAAIARRNQETLERMEAADAAVEGDQVGGPWACAVNDLAGLRAPGC